MEPRITPGQPAAGLVVPGDTYDGAEAEEQRSLAIVDDTCELLIEVALDLAGRSALAARANVFCGPPDYAPDRRPFPSLADEINDRAGDKMDRSEGFLDDELDRWVKKLFESAYETVSLFNVDLWRRVRVAEFVPAQRRPSQIPDDATRNPGDALSGADALRDGNIALPAS